MPASIHERVLLLMMIVLLLVAVPQQQAGGKTDMQAVNPTDRRTDGPDPQPNKSSSILYGELKMAFQRHFWRANRRTYWHPNSHLLAPQ